MSDLTKEEKLELKFQELAEFLGLVNPPTLSTKKEGYAGYREEKKEYAKDKYEYIQYLLWGVLYRKYKPYHRFTVMSDEGRRVDPNARLIPQEFLDLIWEKCGGSKGGRKTAMAKALIKLKKDKI